MSSSASLVHIHPTMSTNANSSDLSKLFAEFNPSRYKFYDKEVRDFILVQKLTKTMHESKPWLFGCIDGKGIVTKEMRLTQECNALFFSQSCGGFF